MVSETSENKRLDNWKPAGLETQFILLDTHLI